MMVLKKFGIKSGEVTEVCDLDSISLGLGVDLEVVRAAICKDLAVTTCNLVIIAVVEPFCKPPPDVVASFIVTEADNMSINLNWAYIVVFE